MAYWETGNRGVGPGVPGMNGGGESEGFYRDPWHISRQTSASSSYCSLHASFFLAMPRFFVCFYIHLEKYKGQGGFAFAQLVESQIFSEILLRGERNMSHVCLHYR